MDEILQKKIKLANMIRATGKQTEIPKECEEYLQQVELEDCMCNTRHGQTHYYLIKPKQQGKLVPFILNIHGGGFCQGHADRDIIFCAKIAAKTQAVVLDLDYKLAPEYPFPIAYEEAYDLVKWAYENADCLGVDRNKFVLCGHSAGGNLAAAVAMESVRTKEFSIRLEILDYPPTDLVTDPIEKNNLNLSEQVLERFRTFNTLYTEEPENPYVSMVLAPKEMLKNMPETLLITAQYDLLAKEAIQFAFVLIDVGVQVTVRKFMNSEHGFTVYCSGDEWRESQQLICDVICHLT